MCHLILERLRYLICHVMYPAAAPDPDSVSTAPYFVLIG